MKYQRVKKNADFQTLFKKGKKVFSPYMTLLYLPCDKLSMGLAVSKKHGKAVKRNRIKRLIRAAFSATCDMLSRPYTMIVVPKVAEEYDYQTFEKSFKHCFKRVNECG